MTEQWVGVIEFTLNGHTLSVSEGTTILQAAMQVGVEIPYFCYHPRLSVAANCRMCLVEVESVGKPQASCMTQVRNGMVIHTQSPMVRKAQEGAMEFLLLNHPLDCPVCDQGGECDLQNIAFRYGKGQSRSSCCKRAVTPKDMGPLVGTAMTRCIHCTRCIRFAREIAGIPELNIQGRGEHAEIMTYMNEAVRSELSGNLTDICPVGALTNKPYGMRWRPWELTHVPTVDVMDGMGSHVWMDTRDDKLLRVRPRTCEAINQDWLADYSRYCIDGLQHQRLAEPAVRSEGGLLKPTTWPDAVDRVADLFRTTQPHDTAVLLGDLVDVETAVLLRYMLDQRGIIHRDSRLYPIPSNDRTYYTLPSMEQIEASDAVVLVNAQLRRTAPLLNIRLRGKSVAYVGQETDYTYPTTWLGQNLTSLLDKTSSFAEVLRRAERPLILVDPSVYNSPDLCKELHALMGAYPAFHWPDGVGFGCVGHTASHTGALDAGFIPGQDGFNTNEILSNLKQFKLLMLVGFDDTRLASIKPEGHVVYMGHHHDVGAEMASVVLPTHAYTEKVASYTNIFGTRQATAIAVSGPEHARSDWHIVQALHQKLGGELQLQHASDIPYPAAQRSTTWRPWPVNSQSIWTMPCSSQNVVARHSPTWRSVGF